MTAYTAKIAFNVFHNAKPEIPFCIGDGLDGFHDAQAVTMQTIQPAGFEVCPQGVDSLNPRKIGLVKVKKLSAGGF